jgi:hypothetical protein
MFRASSMVASLWLIGCGASLVAVQDEGPVLIEHHPSGEVRDAVVRALLARRYTAESEQPGRIMALYRRGEIEFRMLVEYSESAYHVSYAGSTGLEFGVDEETGEPLIDSRIVRWRRGLSRSIEQELLRPERERRQAAEAQRRHDLAVATEQRRRAEAERDANARAAQPPQPGGPSPLVILQHVPPVAGAGGGVNLQHHRQRGSSTQSFHCCVNGAYYSCPGQAAFESCVSLGPTECTREPARDGSCS